MKKSLFNYTPHAVRNLLSDRMSAEILSLSMGEAPCTFCTCTITKNLAYPLPKLIDPSSNLHSLCLASCFKSACQAHKQNILIYIIYITCDSNQFSSQCNFLCPIFLLLMNLTDTFFPPSRNNIQEFLLSQLFIHLCILLVIKASTVRERQSEPLVLMY